MKLVTTPFFRMDCLTRLTPPSWSVLPLQRITLFRLAASLGLLGLLTLALPGMVLAQQDGTDSPDGASAELLFSDGEQWSPAVMLDSHFSLDVDGLIASLRLVQTFRNADRHWQEAVYRFPMHEDSAVRQLTIHIDERVIKGKVVEKQTARREYEAAKREGKVASIVEQSRPNLFTVKLANIAPNAAIRVELDVLMPIDIDGNTASLTLPSTMTPRYVNALVSDPGDVISSIATSTTANTHALPFATLEMRMNPADALARVRSDSHELQLLQDRVLVNRTPMDRDFRLSWPWKTVAAGAALHHARESDSTGDYLQLLITPGTRESTPLTHQPRELVLIADKSGSMAGVSMIALRESLYRAIEALTPEDRFNIIAFDDRSHPLFSSPRPVDDATLGAARNFIGSLEAEGGTEMLQALEIAMQGNPLPTDADTDTETDTDTDTDTDTETDTETGTGTDTGTDATRLRQIVFLTDGSVGYEDQIIRAIAKSIGDQRLFAVGIGSAPNRWFIEQAALVGGGAALSIRDAADAQDALTRLLDTLSRPALTDIEIEWTGADAEMHPNRIPDLYADNPMLLLAKLDPSTTGLRISGSLQGESWEKEVRFDATAMPSGDDDVSPSLADSSTIPSTTSSMASSKTPGTAPGATPGTASTSGAQAGSDTTMMSATGLLWNRFAMRTLLNEQRLSSDPELHKEAITEIALSAGLVSPYTSYIAVEQQPVRPADASLGQSEVVNRMPAGNQMQSVMLPQGSAGSDTLKWLALISAIIGFALLYMSSLSVYARNERPTA